MDSYRVEKKAAMKIALADSGAEIESVPTDTSGHKIEPELDRLSTIIKTFNENFSSLFTDTDRVAKRIRDDIAPQVAAAAACQNAKENTPHTARIAHDQALSGNAALAEGRHAGLQTVRKKRLVQALRRRHGVRAHEPVMKRARLPLRLLSSGKGLADR